MRPRPLIPAVFIRNFFKQNRIIGTWHSARSVRAAPAKDRQRLTVFLFIVFAYGFGAFVAATPLRKKFFTAPYLFWDVGSANITLFVGKCVLKRDAGFRLDRIFSNPCIYTQAYSNCSLWTLSPRAALPLIRTGCEIFGKVKSLPISVFTVDRAYNDKLL